MYAENGAQAGFVFAADAALPPLLELEQAASSMVPATAEPMSAIRPRLARAVMVPPNWSDPPDADAGVVV
jgi:hypothetical protein